jgi:hypothetical protein
MIVTDKPSGRLKDFIRLGITRAIGGFCAAFDAA